MLASLATCQVARVQRRIWCSTAWSTKFSELHGILQSAAARTDSKLCMVVGTLAFAEEELRRQARRGRGNEFVAVVTPTDKLNSRALDLAHHVLLLRLYCSQVLVAAFHHVSSQAHPAGSAHLAHGSTGL